MTRVYSNQRSTRPRYRLLHRYCYTPVSQCFGGLGEVDAESVWRILYSLLVVAMITAFLVLQTLACFRAKQNSLMDDSGPLHGDVATAHSGTS